ncbi:MAG: UDP-N-acetylmuramate dehydrogenase [Clostridiales Family XIII bacterium]|jgi:UDP-N-acetylmuramate dehydrogenase|nr:UDP-N-acetylmuramate dehydrogenase [Clostridiales Family XIII bacterium]
MYEKLARVLGADRVFENVRLSEYTSFRIGGPADLFLTPSNADGLIQSLQLLRREGIPWFIFGNGTNLLVRDGGFRGALIQIGTDFSAQCFPDHYTQEAETMLMADAGQLLSALSARAAACGLSGLEFAGGIPGSVGGGLFMNAGAYGGELSDVVAVAVYYDIVDDNIVTVNNSQMQLSYRDSMFRQRNSVILQVAFTLSFGDVTEINDRMTDFRKRRASSQPLSEPSAGSFFKRPQGAYAAKLIDDAGLRGISVGGAMVSEKHAGFIVNTGGATAKDVLMLMDLVRDEVRKRSGITLYPEPEIIGEDEGGI